MVQFWWVLFQFNYWKLISKNRFNQHSLLLNAITYFETVDKQNAFGSRISGVSHASLSQDLKRLNGSLIEILSSKNFSFSLQYLFRRAVNDVSYENSAKNLFHSIKTDSVNLQARSTVDIFLIVDWMSLMFWKKSRELYVRNRLRQNDEYTVTNNTNK